MSRTGIIACLVLTCLGCSDRTSSTPSPTAREERVASTQGGAIVLSRDERIAVATNRTAGVVTIVHLDPKKAPSELVVGAPVLIETGAGSEPWAAVIGPDDDTAYVVLRGAGVVMRVSGIRGSAPTSTGTARVGSDPTAIAISPSGTYLFVANSGDGTVSTIKTDEPNGFAELAVRFDLNLKLAESGVLGNIEARPGLAHPRALAMTDDGDRDDTDETLYVTEFFSQPIPNGSFDLSSVDQNRQGLVYTIPVSGSGFADSPVFSISPVADTGFLDGAGAMTSCFPNQLYAAVVAGSRLLVSAMCASPRGPVGPKAPDGSATSANFKTAVHSSLFALDLTVEQPSSIPMVLTKVLEDLHAGDEATTPLRMPLIPNDIAFDQNPGDDGLRTAYLTAFGADAVFRLDFDPDPASPGSPGALRAIGRQNARFIDLRVPSGRLPVGVVLSKTTSHPFALVLNDATQGLSVIDRASDSVVTAHATTDRSEGSAAAQILESPENHGRTLFATGLDAWSYAGQAWNSCESCHPDGGSDGLTWYFTRGPRRTISTVATYDGSSPRQRRLMLWTANIDEVHDVEVIARTVSGGVGGILWRYATPPSADCRIAYDGTGCSSSSAPGTCSLDGGGGEPCPAQKHTSTLRNGLNGSLAEVLGNDSCARTAEACDATSIDDWSAIDAFVRSLSARKGLRVGPAFADLDFADVDAGVTLFRRGKCAACHGGPAWTISRVFYTPGAEANGALTYVAPGAGVVDLLGSLRRTTYRVESELLRGLNPPSRNADGVALLRSWAPENDTEETARTLAYANAPGDQINCVLRDVGTFPIQPTPDAANPTPAANTIGIVPSGAPPVFEVRQDMKTLAIGGTGFNIPSLLGLASGAPYFHAGNARTLEEVFDPVFRAHYQAIVPGFLDDSASHADAVRALVSYLLSIDETTFVEEVPSDLPFNPVLCPE